ncbi:MAG TPA: GIY-YIG nuclease family protein [Candidatus Methylomirabilis sp.]|nr:GIY-YIG nuclease family protein [Candidatus Methylomirabilis sp.]
MYCLLLWVARPRWIRLTRLGACRLERGWYVYTGSAKRNLLPRLERHLRRRKPLHWHIDSLREVASVRRIWVWPWTPTRECRTNGRVRRLPKARVPFKGFGSSDCRCIAHLVWFPCETAPPDPGGAFTYHVRRGRIRRAEVEP